MIKHSIIKPVGCSEKSSLGRRRMMEKVFDISLLDFATVSRRENFYFGVVIGEKVDQWHDPAG
jgi:hypothetical protein